MCVNIYMNDYMNYPCINIFYHHIVDTFMSLWPGICDSTTTITTTTTSIIIIHRRNGRNQSSVN